MLRHRTQTFSSRQKIGLILILVGVFCLGIIFSLRIYQKSREKILSFSRLPKFEEEISEDLFPSQIQIPKVKIDLLISPAKAKNEIWEISKDGVSYLLGSGVPGRNGNSVIYGHNKNNLFGPIRWLKVGDEIRIKNRKGEEFLYKVKETKTVSPENIEVLAPTKDPALTLYTCTGFMDSQRFVVVAKISPY